MGLLKTSTLSLSNGPDFMPLLRCVYLSWPLLISHLYVTFKLGSLGEGLSQADLATRVYIVALLYGESAARRRVEKDQGINDLAGLFNDLKIRLDDSFSFTKEQRVCASFHA